MIHRTLVLLAIAALLSSPRAEAAKRNFVFILADDYGIMDVGIEGSKFYETPNLDRLARGGMRFTQGYATCQVCSPSRASIMLGQYPARHGITDWIGAATGERWKRNDRVLPPEYVHALPAKDTTLAEAMRDGGYKTFFAGKWHLGDKGSAPTDHGFEINKGGGRPGSPYNGFFVPYKNPTLPDGPPGESLPIRLGQETANFIEDNRDKPFFAYLSFYSVHGPIQTSKELWSKYQKKATAAAEGKDGRFIFDRTMGVRQVQDNPIYAGMVESMDSAIGIVLDKLDALDLADDTVVIFTSDNGGVSSGDAFSTSNLPYRGGKGRQWEGGIREPYYIKAPGVTKAGTTTAIPATGTDFYPTILELAGLAAKPKQHIDGVSLVPVLKGGQLPAERDLFWHYPHYGNQGGEPSSIIRSGDWKLIRYFEDGREELYQLSKDIGEQNDLAKKQPARVSDLSQKLDKFLKETGARIPKSDSRYNAEKKKQQREHAKTKGVERLETRHANYLKPDYVPNKSWWGSEVTKD